MNRLTLFNSETNHDFVWEYPSMQRECKEINLNYKTLDVISWKIACSVGDNVFINKMQLIKNFIEDQIKEN